MDLATFHACLCDPTRLRIVNLLTRGPLCVCHLQDILDEPQVKVSKHLGYLKTRGLVAVRKEANWRIYRLAERPGQAVAAHLDCLREVATADKLLRQDLARLENLREQPDRACSRPAKLARG